LDNPFLLPQGTHTSQLAAYLDPHAQSLPVKVAAAHLEGDYYDDQRSEVHSVASDFTMNRQFFKTHANGDDLASMQSTLLQSIRKVRVVGKKKERNVT